MGSQSGVEMGGLCSCTDRNGQAKEGGLVIGKQIIIPLNVNDVAILPEPVLTIKETSF